MSFSVSADIARHLITSSSGSVPRCSVCGLTAVDSCVFIADCTNRAALLSGILAQCTYISLQNLLPHLAGKTAWPISIKFDTLDHF